MDYKTLNFWNSFRSQTVLHANQIMGLIEYGDILHLRSIFDNLLQHLLNQIKCNKRFGVWIPKFLFLDA